MLVYAATQPGIGKNQNEDGILLGDVFVREPLKIEVPPQGFMAVADGVGGLAGGAMASEYILKELRPYRFWGTGLSADSIREMLVNANNDLIKTSAKIPHLAAMGTTLTAVYLDHRCNYLIHVGDTRAYIKQGRYLKQLTDDHTMYNELKKQGRNGEAVSVGRNVITACFGGGNPELLRKLEVTPLETKGLFVLTSDGVHDYVEIDILESIMLKGANPAIMCRAMLDAAVAAGSRDDLSVVMLGI